ncbi:MAG: hypothetical protein P1U89_03570 [Verrucomicrobiales bacterium]|nr:hypothetical protein [Verrucomicrobiales bacterium]
MARPKNSAETTQLTLSTTPQVKQLLEELSTSGYYGKNAAETAAILLTEKIRELQAKGQAPAPRYRVTEIRPDDNDQS